MKAEKPWVLLVLGLFIIITSALAISSGVLDTFKTTKKGDPPPLVYNVTTLDDALTDLRGIGCSIVDSVAIEAKSGSTPTPLSDYSMFRTIAYQKAIVYRVTILGETTLYTSTRDNIFYSWIPSGQTMLFPPIYDQLIVTNTTAVKVNGGWMITMVFTRDGDNGDCISRVTVNGLEIPYPNYSASYVISGNLATDLVYQGTYLDGVVYREAHIWISDRMDYSSGESILVRTKSLGGYVYNKIVKLP
jgi:hypothetical protein